MLKVLVLYGAAVAWCGPAVAAQIVALDLKPSGKVSKDLVESLTPLLVTEVARHEGMSVVSQFDVKAFLENEGNKQALGCNDTTCMTQVAGALGAELLLASTLGRIDDTWICTLTLIRVDTATAVRRSTGKQRGSTSASAEAVALAVRDLFRDGLPADLRGPGSMSFRGFEAVLLGFRKAVLDPSQDPKKLRKRLILDLVNTELEYDVNPKLGLFYDSQSRSTSSIRRDLLTAKDEADLKRYLAGLRQWGAVYRDVERVKEIRERARERGLVPLGRPLRFEDPEPTKWPPLAEISSYQEEARTAHALVQKAVAAMTAGDQAKFRGCFLADRHSHADTEWDRRRKGITKGELSFDLLPFFATPPGRYETAIRSLDKQVLQVFLRRFKAGVIQGTETLRLQRERGVWKIHTW